MSPAELFYVGGMSLISLAFPTLLVVMWARDRVQQRAVTAKAPRARTIGAPRSA